MKGKITTYLLGRGWSRSPAEFVDECGCETRISICSSPARWIDRRGVAMCAQHAYSAQLSEDRWGRR